MALLEPVVPEEQQHTACLLAISKTLDRWRVEDRHDGKPKDRHDRLAGRLREVNAPICAGESSDIAASAYLSREGLDSRGGR